MFTKHWICCHQDLKKRLFTIPFAWKQKKCQTKRGELCKFWNLTIVNTCICEFLCRQEIVSSCNYDERLRFMWMVNSRSYLWHWRKRVHESFGATGKFRFICKIENLETAVYLAIDNFVSQFNVIQVKNLSGSNYCATFNYSVIISSITFAGWLWSGLWFVHKAAHWMSQI